MNWRHSYGIIVIIVDDQRPGLSNLLSSLEVENLPRAMAWAMDSGDREVWFGAFSDDVRYVVPQYDIDIRGKEALRDFAEVAVFGLEERRFSAITNILVEVKGETATGKDYFMHYGYPIDLETGQASELRNLSEGQHFHEFARQDGVWKITRMEVHLNRRQEGVP